MGAGVVSWNAWGVFWGDSWGSSWGPLHEVEEGRRPRTHPNLKLQRIREGYVLLQGADGRMQCGWVTARGGVIEEQAFELPGVAYVWGTASYGRTGQIVARGASVAELCGISAAADTGVVHGCGGAGQTMSGCMAQVTGGGVGASGAGAAQLEWDEGSEGFEGVIAGKGVRNPTDEELALLAIRLVS